jgi:hypothetical protein
VFQDLELAIEIEASIEIFAGIGIIELVVDTLICIKIALGDVLLSYEFPTQTSIDLNWIPDVPLILRCDTQGCGRGSVGSCGPNDFYIVKFFALLLSQSDVAAVAQTGFAIT